jgi:hypothetical protein
MMTTEEQLADTQPAPPMCMFCDGHGIRRIVRGDEDLGASACAKCKGTGLQQTWCADCLDKDAPIVLCPDDDVRCQACARFAALPAASKTAALLAELGCDRETPLAFVLARYRESRGLR